MARKRRRDVIDETVVGAYHITSRTARRAFLTGFDPRTRRDTSHRKELIRLRIELLASVFAIDVCDHTVLDNHLHLILRNRPDIVAGWSDQEVARRWLRLNHSTLSLRDEPKQEWVDALVKDKKKLAAAQRALSSTSEFMKQLKCAVAVREDGNGYDGVQSGRRASNKGYLGVKFTEYVELLDAIMRSLGVPELML